MADYNFDFNGDSLLPEQDNLFDDLLDDLAFQTEIANYDTTFLDFDFGGGILDLPDGSGGVFDGATLPGPAVPSSGQHSQQLQQQQQQYVFDFDGNIEPMQPPARPRFNSASAEAAQRESSGGSATHKRKKPSESSTKPSKKAAEFLPPMDVPLSLLSPAKINALTQLPVTLLKAFNGGDIQKVREMVRDTTLKNCALKTPALDTEVFGQNFICDFFESVYDSHPDAVWVAKKSKYTPERCEVTSRIYFAGTRIAQASKGTDMSGAYAEHLFKKKNSSLLDEMDISALTEAEICAMRELENLGCNLSVFGKGSMTLLVDEESGKISKFSVMWVITSFRQATI